MALKISFSAKSTKEVTEADAARINERLRGLLSPNFGEGLVRDMIKDGLELRRMGDALESDVSGTERRDLESDFYSLAGKIRRETAALVDSKRQESPRVTIVNSPVKTTLPRVNVESFPVTQPAQALIIRGKTVDRRSSRLKPVVVSVNRKLSEPERDGKKGNEEDGAVSPL